MNWKKIRGFNYWVSDEGQVKNADDFIMKPEMSYQEYHRIALIKDGKYHKFNIHRLVAIAFIPNPEKKPQVNHKNGIKNDNRISNLEWCTGSENALHAVRTGRWKPSIGEKNKRSILKEKQVIEIKKILNEGTKSMYRLAKDYGVHKVTIFDIKYGNTWKHV